MTQGSAEQGGSDQNGSDQNGSLEPPADHARSGDDVAAAVQTASAGTPHAGVQAPVEQMAPHAAPVEQVRGDAAMTGGRVVEGPGEVASTPSSPDPAAAGSGGAQSVVGARASDRIAAGEDAPDGPPFEAEPAPGG